MDTQRQTGSSPPRSEVLLRRSPRAIQVLCAVLLMAIALSIFYGVVVYLRFHQYYGRNLNDKLIDLGVMGLEAMVGCALFGLGINLLRGRARRADRGLFSPGALRTWAVVFALLPLPLVLASWEVALHFHFFFGWCWGAAAACLLLARHRSRRVPVDLADVARPIE